MKKKTLEWGETPFDDMTPDELLLEVRRMYSALVSVNSALRLLQINEETEERSPFFGPHGTAGDALEKARQILEPIHNRIEGGNEDIYRSFYRYADDLLFDRSTGYGIGAGWAICPICGTLLGENMKGESMSGRRCGEAFPPGGDCPGIFRALTWEDLKPEKGKTDRRDDSLSPDSSPSLYEP